MTGKISDMTIAASPLAAPTDYIEIMRPGSPNLTRRILLASAVALAFTPIAAEAWVDANGSDITGALGVQGRPFLTVNAALDAITSTGGNIYAGIGRFDPVAPAFRTQCCAGLSLTTT